MEFKVLGGYPAKIGKIQIIHRQRFYQVLKPVKPLELLEPIQLNTYFCSYAN